MPKEVAEAIAKRELEIDNSPLLYPNATGGNSFCHSSLTPNRLPALYGINPSSASRTNLRNSYSIVESSPPTPPLISICFSGNSF